MSTVTSLSSSRQRVRLSSRRSRRLRKSCPLRTIRVSFRSWHLSVLSGLHRVREFLTKFGLQRTASGILEFYETRKMAGFLYMDRDCKRTWSNRVWWQTSTNNLKTERRFAVEIRKFPRWNFVYHVQLHLSDHRHKVCARFFRARVFAGHDRDAGIGCESDVGATTLPRAAEGRHGDVGLYQRRQVLVGRFRMVG